MKYVALLRGINVGGNNSIKMPVLKTYFEKAGFKNIQTYIQSGNVIFESTETDFHSLTGKIEKTLSRELGYPMRIVLVSQRQLKQIIKNIPKGFGAKPDQYRYDVIFLIPPMTSAKAIKEMPIKEGVDEMWAGKGVVYFSRLIKKATQSKLSRIVGTPIYKNMSIRNWNTTSKLLSLIEQK